MEELKGTLTRKIGPLPAYVYGVAVLVVVWLVYFGRKYFGGGSAADSVGTSVAAVSDNLDTAQTVDQSTVQSSTGGGAAVLPTQQAPDSNQAWFQLAVNYLLGFGYQGSAVTDALTKFLTGQDLTAADRALVNQAIAKFGAPPEGVPVSSGSPNNPPPLPNDNTPTPEPQPDTNPAPSSQRTYVVKSGDTLSRISQLYYGTASKWGTIYNTNSGVIEAAARAHGKSSSKGPNGSVGWWIYPGTQLVIP